MGKVFRLLSLAAEELRVLTSSLLHSRHQHLRIRAETSMIIVGVMTPMRADSDAN